MKIGTAFFTLIVLLVGFGYLASTSLNQFQEIQDLRQANETLNRQLQGSRQAQGNAEQRLYEIQLQLAKQAETIERQGKELQGQLAANQSQLAELDRLQLALLELDRQRQAEVTHRDVLAGQLNQCLNQAAQPTSNPPGPGESQETALQSLALDSTTWAEVLGLGPEQAQVLNWLALLLLIECSAALYGIYRYQRRKIIRRAALR